MNLQSKAQFNLQSVGEHKTGYGAKNKTFFMRYSLEKSSRLFPCIFFPF